jgi:hypothetical protein
MSSCGSDPESRSVSVKIRDQRSVHQMVVRSDGMTDCDNQPPIVSVDTFEGLTGPLATCVLQSSSAVSMCKSKAMTVSGGEC